MIQIQTTEKQVLPKARLKSKLEASSDGLDSIVPDLWIDNLPLKPSERVWSNGLPPEPKGGFIRPIEGNKFYPWTRMTSKFDNNRKDFNETILHEPRYALVIDEFLCRMKEREEAAKEKQATRARLIQEEKIKSDIEQEKLASKFRAEENF